jgi:sugar/nucleoside kinase (ribokinase family)
MSKIVGIGNAIVDIVLDLDSEKVLKENAIPKGSKEHVNKKKFDQIYNALDISQATVSSGGSAANTISALGNLGFDTSFLGVAADDEYGKLFESEMSDSGIKLNLIKKEGETGKILHLISSDKEATTIGYSGVNSKFEPRDLSEQYFYGYNYLYIDGYLMNNHELMEALADFGKLNYMKVVFDIASSHFAEGNREFLKKFIKNKVDILFANDLEIFSYTGQEPERAIRKIAKDCDIVVAKLGSRGSYIQRGEEFYHISAAPVDPIDASGAGDLYAAGFLYGLMEDYHLTHCGKVGAFLASKILSRKGARFSFEEWREIKKMI